MQLLRLDMESGINWETSRLSNAGSLDCLELWTWMAIKRKGINSIKKATTTTTAARMATTVGANAQINQRTRKRIVYFAASKAFYDLHLRVDVMLSVRDCECLKRRFEHHLKSSSFPFCCFYCRLRPLKVSLTFSPVPFIVYITSSFLDYLV